MCESEQTTGHRWPNISERFEAIDFGNFEENPLKLKHASFVLLTVVFAAVPAFADKIPSELKRGHETLVSYQDFSAKKDVAEEFAVPVLAHGRFDAHDFRPASLSNSASDLRHGVESIDFGSDLGESIEADGKGLRSPHVDNDLDPRDAIGSVVNVPEPGTQSLLLFGFAGLGLLVFWRKPGRPQSLVILAL